MSPFTTVLEEIDTLDPESDYERIVQLSCGVDFPSDTAKALEFALFRTFCVPSIAARLNRAATTSLRIQERYEHTGTLVSEIVASGIRSERGQMAIDRLKGIRARHPIPDRDWVFVLSTLICEPIRWNARFGWRRLSGKEQLAIFFLWRAVGKALLLANLPDSLPECDRFNRDYERDHARAPRPVPRVSESAGAMAPGSLRVCVENALRLRGRIATRLIRPVRGTRLRPASLAAA